MSERKHLPQSREHLQEKILQMNEEISTLRSQITWHKKQKNELNDKKGSYRAILEDLPDLICRFSPDGMITYVNSAYCTYVNKPLDEIMGTSVFSYIPRNEKNRMTYHLESLSKDCPVRMIDYRAVLPGGQQRWLQWTLRALFDDNDTVSEYLSSGRDVSNMKHVEHGLIDALEKYSTIFESSNDAILLQDNDCILDCNTAALKIFRCGEKELLLNKHYTDFSAKKQPDGEDSELKAQKHIKRALKRGMERFQWVCKRMDGSVFPSDVILSPLNMEGKTIIAAVVRDISEQKQTEEALKKAYDKLEEMVKERTMDLHAANKHLKKEIKEREKAETHLRKSEEHHKLIAEELNIVINGITDNITLQDKRLNVILANKAAADSLDMSPENLIGKTCYQLWHGTNEPCNACPVKKALETGKTHEGIQTTPDNSIWEVHGYPLKDEQGRIMGAIEITRNVTDRKILEEELIRRQKLDSLGTLAGGIAHDFNNILTVILGNVSFAKMLLNTDDKAYARLSDVENASLKAKELTDRLLTFSKGGSPLKKIVSIDRFLQDTITLALKRSGIIPKFSFTENLRPVEIDESQIAQVINNIINNAEQAMPQGGTLTIGVENTSSDTADHLPLPGGNYARICIADTGIGIDSENINNIFDPFFTTKKQGFGLGLATSYSIIKKHGGYITATSQVGKGTCIIIYLPASSEKEITQMTEFEEMHMGKGNILFMDDERFIRDLAKSILTHLGYTVTFAKNGEEAIEEYTKARKQGNPFDVVILDLTIPEGMGGKDCIRKLKEIDPEIKAIVSSGYSDDPIMSTPEKFGFRAFITKPYKIQTLSSVLRKTISEH